MFRKVGMRRGAAACLWAYLITPCIHRQAVKTVLNRREASVIMLVIFLYGKEADPMEFMNVTLTTKDLILAFTPLVLALAYFLMNFVSYQKAKARRETDPEAMTEAMLRMTRTFYTVSFGVLLGVIALYIIVITVIKMGVFK